LEGLVLGVERTLNDRKTKEVWPWLGSDIKIMATRDRAAISIVVAAPILAPLTTCADEYFSRVQQVEKKIRELASGIAPQCDVDEIIINSGDDLKSRKLYLNFTGSAIESGDEGMVGRGNRIGGVITPTRPYTMEGIAGKNPRYHVGKVYSAAAYEIATRLHQNHGINSNIFLINRMAEPLCKPWRTTIETTAKSIDEEAIESVTMDVLSVLENVTTSILAGDYPLF
jgi:S-adenosylmethionine synthetase